MKVVCGLAIRDSRLKDKRGDTHVELNYFIGI